MKKCSRFLAWVMTLVMMFGCYGGTTVFAEEGDTTADTDSASDFCPDHTGWQGLTTATIGQYMTLSGGHYYLNEGSYYLADNLNMGVTIYIWPGATVDLCLNGYDITMTNSNRTILNPKNSATLNLYDCGTQVRYYDENGWVTVDGVAWDDATDEQKAAALESATNPIEVIGGAIYGASSYDKGGAGVFIQNYATFNMYGGNILGCSCSTSGHWGGGVYNYEGTFNMYSGVIAYNSSSSYAGGLFIRSGSTVNMYGGEIAYNYAPTSGAGVYSGGDFTMYGDASIHDNFGSYQASGFYNFGGGTLTMEDDSSIYNNISGDGGSAGVYMPSYNSILNMSDTSSITGNITTGISAGVGLVSGVMTISGDAEVSGNYVVDSITVSDIETTNANGVALKTVSAIGDKVVDSNVYLSNGKTITFDGFYGNDVYVTAAAGLGLVATSVDDTEDSGNLSSDVATYYAVRESDNTEVHLVEAQTLAGKTATKVYDQGTIDLTTLGMFDTISSGTAYTITGGTGTGSIDGTALTVDSIGTFTIKAVTPPSNTYPLTTQTSTLTVTPATVTISGITTIGSVVGTTAELNNTSGTLTGVVNGDDVSIDFSVAYGEITNTTYTTGATGEFDVAIHGISLTGEDAGNYTLGTVNGGSGTSVTINETIPHVSWPTATDLVYGEDRSNSDLMGGIAVVQTGNVEDGYTYTTVTGEFVWISDEIEDAGTHTYEVKFVVSGAYSDEITAAVEDLQALRHNVTQVVQPVEVTFTIGNSIVGSVDGLIDALDITATYDDNGREATLTPQAYELWYYDVDAGAWSTTAPTAQTVNESGEYLLGAALTSDNYRHAGTQESTAKQIGAFVIGSSATAYTVTFVNDGGETVHLSITAIPQTIHILPTLSGDTYTAWEAELAGVTTVYDFGSRFAQPEYNVAFTAVEAATTGEISGTITGTDLTGAEANLEGVVVTLMQGAEQVAVFTTDSDGHYEFNVPQGRYNLVVTRDQVIRNEETTYVYLDSTWEEINITIPDIRQNTVFNVASGMAAITVDGMEDLMGEEEVRSVKVELNPSSDTAAILALAAESNLTTDNAKYYIDLSIQQRVGDATSYTENDLTDPERLTFYIPLAGLYQGYGNYSVYFDDGISAVKILTSGTDFTVTGDLLTLTTQKSGVYGLVFWDTATVATAGTNKTVTYGDTETIATADMFNHIDSTGTRSYLITSEDGGEATIDSAGNVTVTKVGTFTVTVKVAAISELPAYISTATLTVEKKSVTISGITCVDQEVDSESNVVAINTGAFLTGVETGDSVRIDYGSAVGKITDDDYASDTDLNTTGSNTFTVTVTGLVLTGDDAENYEITTVPAISSQVTITMSLVYIAWPTAKDIIYGQTQSNEDLYGGKVVVYDGTTYTDITNSGTFQWVTLAGDDWDGDFGGTTSTAVVDAGTYTYDVQFVENTQSDASYSTALENATQMVTQVVQAAAVTFTIGDSTLADANNVVNDLAVNTTPTMSDYILWYCNVDGGSWTTDVPSVAGSYLLGAELTSANYRHAGTQESTAKQIGAFVIGSDENVAVYNVTFMVGGDTNSTTTDALPQTIHILPTLDDTLEDGSAKYTGWLHENGTTYAFGERFTQPDYNVTFTAIEAPEKTATISGTVTGTDLNGTTNTEISRVGVALYQGSTLVDYTTTGTTGADLGKFSFSVVPGMYNLVITYDLDITTEITYFVDATSVNVVKDVALPDLIQNVVMEVATGVPNMVVSNLESLLDTKKDSEILLEITASDDTATKQIIVNEAAAHGISADEIKEFFNIDLSARIGDDDSFTAVTEADELLTFYIPLTGIYQGHDQYTVYRYHDGEVQTLTETENAAGEYIEVSDNSLIIHAKFFSLYGIAFANETVVVPTTPSTGSGSYVTADEEVESELPFTDVSVDDWFYEDVLYLYNLGLMSGTSATTFSPYSGNSRAMVAQMMYNLEGQPERTEFDFFPDVVEGQWYEPAINWCASYGVVDGYLDGLYRPDTIISRQEFTNVLYDHCLHLGYDMYSLNDLSTFADSPSQWAETYVMWAVETGLIQGDTNGYLNCSDQLTRCEAAAVFARFLRNVYEA